ncbi:LlaJI family restriction endonuclease [Treponema sp.]|uniref:LlaJI family restriction endonuclease n=1 Tax=Treponema sp. TaxID=166 RepID=UPI0025EAE19F|nr:LlaJI family restriction endonuclease [Treponema sp.]MBR4321051.1 LlaJI family restriction endonuclease [Treponema sp.]
MKLKHQKLFSAFFRETKTFYRIGDLKNLLKSSDSSEITLEHANYIYQKLLNENIIKSCTKKQFDLNELNEEEISKKEEEDSTIINSSDKGFYFRFVGVVYVDDCVLKIYPKYINLDKNNASSPDDFENADELQRKNVEKHLKQTLRVVKKISKDSQSASLNNENKEKYNHIGMQIFLLEDYYRNGIYENKETVIETNGEGEIDWDKTINETTAIIKNKKPYYVELQTINTRSNEFDYFKLLHESILCECSNSLRDTGLLEYLGMIPCELTGMELSDFGDVNYIKYRLQQEIRTQFVTRKRNQLVSLLTYITESTSHRNSNTLKLFGSYHFEHVWEVVCKAVFNDLYNNDYRISNTGLKASPTLAELVRAGIIKDNTEPDRTDKENNFKDLIEKVEWNMVRKIGRIICTPEGNLTPDLICIDAKENFYVLDAKYYVVNVNEENKKIQNNPGIQDVLKQFAYERAYNDFLKDYLFTHTLNAFVMPAKFTDWADESKMIMHYKGSVNYKLMQNSSYESLGPIQVLETVPEFLFKNYLNDNICLSALTETLSKKNLLHNINRRKNSDGADYGFVLIGHLRSKYYDQIKNKTVFDFYFYDKDKYQTIAVHPEIMNCSTFIGYDFDNPTETVIMGTVNPTIKKIKGSELRKELEKRGITKDTEDMPSYYSIMIENASCITYSKEQLNVLKKKVDDGRGNYLLDKYAPKVISHE